MEGFLQLHILTSYPPANLNRDDLDRPKSAKMGGTDRLRVSSQSLKRAWRTADIFQQSLDGHIGERTKFLGRKCYNKLYEKLIAKGITEKKAEEEAKKWAKEIAEQFGKLKSKSKDKELQDLEIEQLAHISPFEMENIDKLCSQLVAEGRAPTKEELNLLRKEKQAVDISLFGRMLADAPEFNVEAACQVAHALSVHSVTIEDDYFTAVDDLSEKYREDAGASHIGETGFAAALFYIYICIDREQLVENLGGDGDLAKRAIRAFTEVTLKIPPSGKQNSFASRAYASYALAEIGKQQPRSLSAAYLKAIDVIDLRTSPDGFAEAAVKAMETQRKSFDKIYGDCAEKRYEINAIKEGEGSMNELLDFAVG